MEKIKTCWKRASLRIKFGVYVVVGTLMCFLAAAISAVAFQAKETMIYQKYDEKRHEYVGQVMDKDGRPFSTIHYYEESPEDFLTDRERLIVQICELGQSVGVALWFVLGLLVTSVLFYRNNLKKPIELMDAAAERISRQELDFTIVSDREDELGRLCESFERMRGALQENYREMWRQMEERKRVNAAFSHDLRTPLTVLKGQSEMLAKYVPDGRIPREKIAMTAATMGRHISRLEAYVETMNRVMRLEDIEVKREPVALEALTAQIAEVGKAICGEKFLMVGTYSGEEGGVAISGGCESYRGEAVIMADVSFVMQVAENLLSNCARYAKETVAVAVKYELEESMLCLTVEDDGPGFAPEFLEKACQPFFRQDREMEETNTSTHLGMGLYICQLLCNKHGGGLIIENRKSNGARFRAEFFAPFFKKNSNQ